MHHHRMIYAATLVAALLAAAVQPVDAAAEASSFASMDADGDGRLTRVEHQAAAQRMFQMMDANGDGRVTAGEMQAAQGLIHGGTAPAGGMSSADKIKAVDSDGDGVLSAAEHAAGSEKMFAAMDGNGDGAIDGKEFDAGHAVLTKGAGSR